MPRKVHTVAVPEALALRAARGFMDLAQDSVDNQSYGENITLKDTKEHADAQTLYKLVRDAKNKRKANAPKNHLDAWDGQGKFPGAF